MKKLFSVLLAALLLALPFTAFAEGNLETVELEFDGSTKTAYVVRPFDWTSDWSKVGYWGDRFTFGSTETTAFELDGAIRNCYGVTFTYSVDSVDYGDLETVGIKPGMRLGKKWTFGDKATTVYPVTGEANRMTVLSEKPGTLSAITVVTDKAMNGRLSYSGSYWPDFTVYFAGEDAAESYIESIR